MLYLTVPNMARLRSRDLFPSEEPVRPPGKLIGRQSDIEELASEIGEVDVLFAGRRVGEVPSTAPSASRDPDRLIIPLALGVLRARAQAGGEPRRGGRGKAPARYTAFSTPVSSH